MLQSIIPLIIILLPILALFGVSFGIAKGLSVLANKKDPSPNALPKTNLFESTVKIFVVIVFAIIVFAWAVHPSAGFLPR